MAAITRYESKKYPNNIETKFITNDYDAVNESERFRFSLVKPVEVSLTPRYASEDECFIFTFVLDRHVLNELGYKMVDIKVRYAYRLRLNDLIPTAEELFSLLEEASADFAKYYYERTRYIPLPDNAVRKFFFEEQKEMLEGLIQNWKENLRLLRVDKNGNPLN